MELHDFFKLDSLICKVNFFLLSFYSVSHSLPHVLNLWNILFILSFMSPMKVLILTVRIVFYILAYTCLMTQPGGSRPVGIRVDRKEHLAMKGAGVWD